MKKYQEWGFLIGRIILGIIMIAHGFPKLLNMQNSIQMFESLGLPSFLAYAAAIIESVAGITLLLGAFVTTSAILLGLTMIGAIVLVQFQNGLIGGYEFPLTLLGLSVILALTGSRKWALSSLWTRKQPTDFT